jgi:preprotein translocase subunit SecE
MSPIRFLKDVKDELDRVVWPTRNEVLEASVGIIVLSLFIAFYFWLLDLIFTDMLKFLIR